MKNPLIINNLNKNSYLPVWSAMQRHTQSRKPGATDQLWLVEHPPVFTQGKAGKPEHLLQQSAIPLVQSDRGGQITYHGPGQIMAYTLFDLNRLQLNTRDFVCKLEKTVIDCLAQFDIEANGSREAPGIYVDGAKICSIGLRVKKGFSYHGIALNVNMDLTPFSYINPCGYENLKMAQMSDLNPKATLENVTQTLITCFITQFAYTEHTYITEQQYV